MQGLSKKHHFFFYSLNVLIYFTSQPQFPLPPLLPLPTFPLQPPIHSSSVFFSLGLWVIQPLGPVRDVLILMGWVDVIPIIGWPLPQSPCQSPPSSAQPSHYPKAGQTIGQRLYGWACVSIPPLEVPLVTGGVQFKLLIHLC